MSETAKTDSDTPRPRRRIRLPAQYANLLVTLALVYVAMAALSAVDLDTVKAHPYQPSQWEFGWPRFMIEPGDDGGWQINQFNQRKILEQAAINLTLGVGMTFVILTGGIDLSVGSLLAVCNVLFVRLALDVGGGAGGFSVALAMLACAGVGALCGVANGCVSVLMRIPSFIVTLGSLLVFRGLAYWISEGETRYLACSQTMATLVPIVIPILSIVLASLFLSTTAMGRQVYAVGGNLIASEYSGVRTSRVRIMCFAFSGLCAGLAGIIAWSRVSTGNYLAGEGAELYAIAAVVLGGTRLAGGEGTIIGTMIGALIMAVLANGLNTAGVNEQYQKIIVGCVLIVAAYIDSRRTRNAATAVV